MALNSTHPIRMRLAAHDTAPDVEPAPEVAPVVPEPAKEPVKVDDKPKPVSPAKPAEKQVPDPDLGDAGKRAIQEEREKRKAATAEAATAKAERDAALKRIQEFEDAQKSELEKAQANAERAAARERTANLRAVTSDLRSAAIEADAADAGLVVDLLSRDLDRFLTDSGIDSAAVEKAVAELLDAKPILRKPPPADPASVTPEKRPPPKPDPSQGPRGPVPEKDFRKAPKEEVDAELASYGVRRY